MHESEVSFLTGEHEALRTTGPIEGWPRAESLPIFRVTGLFRWDLKARTVPLPLGTLQQIASSLAGTHLRVHHHPPWMQPHRSVPAPFVPEMQKLNQGKYMQTASGVSDALDVIRPLILLAMELVGTFFLSCE